MKKFWHGLSSELKILILVSIISISVIAAASLRGAEGHSANGSATDSTPGLDTFIPRGFVLVPVEVQNYEALDSILGKYGLVDLFRSRADGGQLIARNVRILRAPQNPSRFAVLVKEAQASRVLEYQGSIFVIVKPPSNDGTQFVKTTSQEKSRRRIIFEGE